MSRFFKCLVKNLGMFLLASVVIPPLVLPVAPFTWLILVSIGVSSMTWGGLFRWWITLVLAFEVLALWAMIGSAWEGSRKKEVEPGMDKAVQKSAAEIEPIVDSAFRQD